jgi:peptidoglycan-associated lipoprotein
MPRTLGFVFFAVLPFFWVSCSKKAVPRSEITRGVPNNDSFQPLIEFGEEQNLVSPSGSAIAGKLGTPDLLIPRDASDQIFADSRNTIRPFEPVYFDFDQYIMKEEERSKVLRMASFLQQNRDARLLIEGYCDWKGTPAYNKALGERRAHSIKDYLIELGADGRRIDTLSIGDESSIPNAVSTQSQLDRRAEFIISRGNE